MKFPSRMHNFSRVKKMVGMILCIYSVSANAQEVDITQFQFNSFSPDTLSATPSDIPAVVETVLVTAQAPEHAASLPVDPTVGGSDNAVAAAVADGVTTGLALSAGAVELNPLISTSPIGLVLMTGMKIGLAKYAETLPEEDKRTTLKSTSALWGGAAVNNLMVLFAAPPPLPIIAGLIMGFATWNHMANQYEEQDQLAAARNAAILASKEKLQNEEAKAVEAKTQVVADAAQAEKEDMTMLAAEVQGFGSSGE